MSLPRLLVVTDRRAARGDLVSQVARVLQGAPALVQVREKDLSARTQVELVRAVVALGAPVVVNDRVDVALAAGARGVHLPENGFSVADARRLLPAGALVGASVHDVDGARARADADYLVLGPIWDTPGKTACGIDVLAEAARVVQTPIFAIGGIDGAERARAARAAGAHGVAAIRAFVGAEDPAAAALALLG
jgi:thiamine-phosphate pyrophosphorylase